MNRLSMRAIIFDDDVDILSICSYILEEEGWEVITYSDCKDIVNRVSKVSPDVILMDNWIPETGGIVATQLLKQTTSTKHIPVVYFSANRNISVLAAQAGADQYIAKPFEIDDLTGAIDKALN